MDKGSGLVVGEIATLVGGETENELEDEIALVREAMRQARLMMTEGELDALGLYRVSRVVIHGAGMVATLLKAKRILSGNVEDRLMDVLGPAIDELFIENGWGDWD